MQYKIIDDANNILSKAIGIEVDYSQPILLQLAEAVQNFNDDSSGQEKLIERVEKKFDNKVLEHIAQQIAIHQVELSSILTNLETSCTNLTSLFGNMCDVTKFTKEIKRKLTKNDEDIKASAQQLQLDPSLSSACHMKIIFLSDMQAKLLREEARI